jgi:hypothetical protein
VTSLLVVVPIVGTELEVMLYIGHVPGMEEAIARLYLKIVMAKAALLRS